MLHNLTACSSSLISHSQEIQRQKRVKFKIIERKYFKPPQEENLLTWDAKEQMRFLNQEYSDEWPVDRLAESFPTSREGVIKILKSKWHPQNLKEVVRHDRRVRARWLALSEAGDGKCQGGPLELRYQKLIEMGKLAYAAGNPSLPMPQSQTFLTDGSDATIIKALVQKSNSDNPRTNLIQKRPPTKPVGKFESLVKDYCESKPKEEIKKKSDEKMLAYANHQSESQKLLEKVVIETVPMVKSSNSKLNTDLLSGPHQENDESTGQIKEQKEDGSLLDYIQERERLYSSQADAILEGQIEIPEDHLLDIPPVSNLHTAQLHPTGHRTLSKNAPGSHPSEMVSSSRGNPQADQLDLPAKRSGRRSLRMRREQSEDRTLEMDMERLQMEGTGKISQSGMNLDNLENNRKPVKKYNIDKEKAEVLNRIRYEFSSTKGGLDEPGDEEVYIYTEEGGYQYPFGRTDRQLRIKVPKQSQEGSQSRVYQKDKAVYDEDGELLYRIP